MKLLTLENIYYLHCGPINVNVHANEIIGISGASGSGKSRLLRVIADLDEHRGDVQLDDINQQKISADQWRKKVALLSAETVWWFDTVGEHFNRLNEKSLQALGFAQDVSAWQISRLSSGEKQRLGLLRLLENQPHVLLLDEPTANLDKTNAALFETFVGDYLQRNSACAIWVSHDVEQLQRVATNRFEIQNGELIHVS